MSRLLSRVGDLYLLYLWSLGDHQATDRLFNYSQIYRLDYDHRYCLVTCRHLLKSSERLFKMFLFRAFKINSFSSRHRPHLLWPGLYGGIFLMIPHLILCGRLLSLSCQMYLESSVSFWYVLLFIDFVWFRNIKTKNIKTRPNFPNTFGNWGTATDHTRSSGESSRKSLHANRARVDVAYALKINY